MTRWEDKNKVLDTFLLAGLFLFYAILVIRSLCVPIPTVTYRKREATWSYVTVYILVCMFLLSHKLHSVIFCICMIGAFAGGMAVKQLNWPVGDVYIQHVVFTNLLCCVSCYLGFQPHERPAFYILIGLQLSVSLLIRYWIRSSYPPLTLFTLLLAIVIWIFRVFPWLFVVTGTSKLILVPSG